MKMLNNLLKIINGNDYDCLLFFSTFELQTLEMTVNLITLIKIYYSSRVGKNVKVGFKTEHFIKLRLGGHSHDFNYSVKWWKSSS